MVVVSRDHGRNWGHCCCVRCLCAGAARSGSAVLPVMHGDADWNGDSAGPLFCISDVSIDGSGAPHCGETDRGPGHLPGAVDTGFELCRSTGFALPQAACALVLVGVRSAALWTSRVGRFFLAGTARSSGDAQLRRRMQSTVARLSPDARLAMFGLEASDEFC